jgi:ubiquinone/menaquinone biosynthesis C-methylase UbiE
MKPTVYGPAMASAYDRGRSMLSADVERWMAAARPFLPAERGRILDLGAGTGRFSEALGTATGATVVACEPAEAMRAVLRANCPQSTVVGGRAETLPFRDNAFDAVWASQVLHHVDLPAVALAVRRVLRPDGHLLVRGGFADPATLPLHPYFPDAWTVRLTLPRLAEVLAAAGLRLVLHKQIPQVYAQSLAELIAKVRSRTLSNLAALPDERFEAGLNALVEHPPKIPVLQALDLVVFGAA